jgi:hypothetical protein
MTRGYNANTIIVLLNPIMLQFYLSFTPRASEMSRHTDVP